MAALCRWYVLKISAWFSYRFNKKVICCLNLLGLITVDEKVAAAMMTREYMTMESVLLSDEVFKVDM